MNKGFSLKKKLLFIFFVLYLCFFFREEILFTVGWGTIAAIGRVLEIFKPAAYVTSIDIYKETPVWELAKAVKSENIEKINFLCSQNIDWINYKEPIAGTPLLYWAVGSGKYKSVEALLKRGGNPNIYQNSSGTTPIFLASSFRWNEKSLKNNPQYIKILLEYGADPNIPCSDNAYDSFWDNSFPDKGSTPLMHAVKSIDDNRTIIQLLLENGANINAKTNTGATAASFALYYGHYKNAYQLIVENHAQIKDAYYDSTLDKKNTGENEKKYPVELLNEYIWEVDSNTPEYKIKESIIAEFKRQGVDYYKTNIIEEKK